MRRFFIPTPPMRAGSTRCGACTPGSIAHQRAGTRAAPGGNVATSTPVARQSRYTGTGDTDMLSGRASHQAFFGISALLFLVSAAVTIHWCSHMAMMDGMPMPGGWTMSMTWMPGRNGARALLSFLGMWVTMMMAMMLPSLVPMLWRYRRAAGRKGAVRLERLTALAGTGYFLVWAALGIAAFPIGVALAASAMQYPALAHAVPAAIGVVILIVGVFQFTAWKSRHLACCRSALPRIPATDMI